MVEKIEEPSLPVTTTLRYLESNLLCQDIKRALNRKEIKYVSRRVLEALSLLHEEGFVHAGRNLHRLPPPVRFCKWLTLGILGDIKPDNVFFNLREGANRFSDVQLGDFSSCCYIESKYTTSAGQAGAPMWSSPEILLELPWNNATDI